MLLAAVAMTVCYAKAYNQILASLWMYLGAIYALVIHGMAEEYVLLAANHLTFKERSVRKREAKSIGLKDY